MRTDADHAARPSFLLRLGSSYATKSGGIYQDSLHTPDRI